MSSRSALRNLVLGAVACSLALVPADLALAQEDQQRCEGAVVDDQGNPVAGVTITFLHVQKNVYAQPVKTSKKGRYAHNTLTATDYEAKAELTGHKMVKITTLTTTQDGGTATDDNYVVGDDQKVHKFHVSPQARGDIRSKGKCVIDFVLAPEDRYQEAYRKAAEEKLASQGKAPPDAGSASAGTGAAAPAAPPAPPVRDPADKCAEAYASRDYGSAIAPCQEAVTAAPDRPEVHRYLGDAYVQVGNLAEAEPELKKAIELDPTTSGANFAMAQLFIKKGRLMQAVPYLEKELEINPGAPTILQNLGKLYVETKQYDKAVGIYEQLIEQSPDNMENYALLADCYKQMGDTAKEQQTYQKMGASDSSGQAFYNLGNMLFNKDEKEKAAEAYKKAIEQNPKHADAHFQLGMTYVGLAKFKEAVTELETFVKLKPGDPRAGEAKTMVVDLRKMGG